MKKVLYRFYLDFEKEENWVNDIGSTRSDCSFLVNVHLLIF